MSERATFRLVHKLARDRAMAAIHLAPDGSIVTVGPPTRSLDANAKAHALFAAIAKAKPEWAGIKMGADDWKSLMVLSHAIATDGPDRRLRLVPDLEGQGYIQLRESTARMSKARAASLIDYVQAWAVSHGIPISDPAPVKDGR